MSFLWGAWHRGGDPLQLVGQWAIKTFWAVQSTSRLWCDSQGCPMITDCCPKLVTANCALSECHPKCRRVWTSSVTEPCSLVEPSTLCNRMGWGSGVVSSQCFCTKSRLMNIPVALESKRVEVATVKTCIMLQKTPVWILLGEWGGT